MITVATNKSFLRITYAQRNALDLRKLLYQMLKPFFAIIVIKNLKSTDSKVKTVINQKKKPWYSFHSPYYFKRNLTFSMSSTSIITFWFYRIICGFRIISKYIIDFFIKESIFFYYFILSSRRRGFRFIWLSTVFLEHMNY